ncbi:MAG: hypothetical protein WCT11_04440 [Candidatus Magasanikbacteria bacterium]
MKSSGAKNNQPKGGLMSRDRDNWDTIKRLRREIPLIVQELYGDLSRRGKVSRKEADEVILFYNEQFPKGESRRLELDDDWFEGEPKSKDLLDTLVAKIKEFIKAVDDNRRNRPVRVVLDPYAWDDSHHPPTPKVW